MLILNIFRREDKGLMNDIFLRINKVDITFRDMFVSLRKLDNPGFHTYAL